MKHRITILIADDHELYVDGIKGFFKDHPIYTIVGEAFNGEDLVRKAELLLPHIVLTDLKMPIMNGSQAIIKILSNHPQIHCIVLTNYENDISIVRALEAGAKGYLTKNMPKHELFNALEQVCKGYPYYCKTTNTKLIRLISHSSYNPYKEVKIPVFTAIEMKIIEMICQEKSNHEMAISLCKGRRTIENIRARIYDKMEIKSAAGLAIYAIKQGLYTYDE